MLFMNHLCGVRMQCPVSDEAQDSSHLRTSCSLVNKILMQDASSVTHCGHVNTAWGVVYTSGVA